MTIPECYNLMKGDYLGARRILLSDAMIERMILKFPGDKNYQKLCDAIASGNIRESFTAVHTLKGLAANLAMTELREHASNLTEQLRSCTEPADLSLFEKVKTSYKQVVDAIEQYKKEKGL